MATDNMRLFILTLPRPNTNTQTVAAENEQRKPWTADQFLFASTPIVVYHTECPLA
jgi:hypothetical protein